MENKNTRLTLFLVLVISEVFLSVGLLQGAENSKNAQPNVILIIGDDMSVDDFGCYGHPNIRTPNIDKLAANGVRFTNAYLTSSQCSPTRCSVISGRYPHNTGAPELHQPLPETQPMFPLEIRNAGYYTAAAGKWHLGENAKKAFDRIEGGRPGGEEHWVEVLEERPKDKPFFMWFAAHDAHRGWDKSGVSKKHTKEDVVIPPYMADMEGTREDFANYYDEIQRMDRYVGLVVEELKRQKVYDNTVIIVMADNGRPLPRSKTWLYDSGIKTPFVVHWPKGISQSGSVCKSLISTIDIAPTVLELAHVKSPKSFQGISFKKLLNNPEKTTRKYVFAEHNWHDMEAHERMERWENWVYIRNARPQLSGWVFGHARTPSFQDLLMLQNQNKLTEAQANAFLFPRPAESLFNIEEDYHQLNNLAENSKHNEILAFMRNKLDEWQDETGDTTPEELTPDFIDRETYKRIGESYIPAFRGTTPGSERNATTINNPGPR